jgi:hypothetical protein
MLDKNKKIKTIVLFSIFFAICFAMFPSKAEAAGLVPCGTATSPCTLCHLIIGIKGLIDWGFAILVTASLVAVAIAGVMYTVSSGSEQMMGTAKSFLKSALIGFAIVLAAWLLVNTTMWLLSIKTDLGIGKTSGWAKFTCDTSSTALTGTTPPPTDPTEKKCCVKSDDKTKFGKDNCSEATGEQTKAQCQEKCPELYQKPEEVTACKEKCVDTPAKCEDGKEPVSCTAEACVGAGEKGNCAGFPTAGDDNECSLVSEDLNKLLSCMKNNNTPGTITSITSEGAGGNLATSKGCCGHGGTATCPHANNTCHHGCKLGGDKQGYSYAIDIGVSGASDSNLCAIAEGAKTCGAGQILGPADKTCAKGASIKYWSGHGTHLHISTGSCSG